LSLSTEALFVLIENPQLAIEKLLELIRMFGKVAVYKITFLCIINRQKQELKLGKGNIYNSY
jgi:hypothetical protein